MFTRHRRADEREAGPSTELVVETDELTKRYATGQLAVDRLALRVRRGEIYGFIGPNGAGKTTTLRMLVGLIAPTAGTVRVLGAPPSSPESLGRLGALIETPTFYPYLSGRDNLRAMALYAGCDRHAVEAAMAQVKLTDRASDRFQTYSLGMKQRLGVAAALLKDPAFLILDEPTNGLDPPGMADMHALIQDLGRSGRTVLFSSHLLGDVAALCDRVGVIAGGRLVVEGTVAELCGEGDLVLRADPLSVAQGTVAAIVGVDRVRVADGALVVNAGSAQVPAVSRALAAAGVAVLELRRRERPLAEVFFELTDEVATNGKPANTREG